MTADPDAHLSGAHEKYQGRNPIKSLPSLPLLLTPERAAQELSLSTWSVRQFIRQGRLKALASGRRHLIRREELWRFIDEELVEVEVPA
jgi:excisionase family DNA binding protein